MPTTVDFLTPAELRATLRGMAAVAVLFEPRVAFRDYLFRVLPEPGGATARWGDFAGNTCHFLFHPLGSVALGFDHESPMSPHASCTGPDDFRAWPGVYESLPPQLMDAIQANPFGEGFDYREVTFCLWNQSGTKEWQKGDIEYPEREYQDADGESFILGCIRHYAANFVGRIQSRHGKWDLDDEGAVAELLSGDEITRDCLRRVNPKCNPDAVTPDLTAMGYRVT